MEVWNTRNNHLATMKNLIIPFALLALMTACGDNNNGKRQENVEQNNKVMTLNIDHFRWT